MKYASFTRRIIAFLLDGIVIQIPFSIVFGFKDYSTFALGLYVVVWTAYIVWMTAEYGATIGKMIMKIKIVKENREELNYSDALLRELTTYLSAIVFLLGYLNVIWDEKHQAWHDKLAKTIVIRNA